MYLQSAQLDPICISKWNSNETIFHIAICRSEIIEIIRQMLLDILK